MTEKKTYPDISDILERKREGRLIAARRSFSEKLDWLERAREELRPFEEARNRRIRAQAAARSDAKGQNR